MNKELFQKVLTNRAQSKKHNKGVRINTKKAVKDLKGRLESLISEGYDDEVLMNLMLKRNWLSIKKKWLEGLIQAPDLTAPTSITGTLQELNRSTQMPTFNHKQKAAHEAQVRKDCTVASEFGLAELKRMKEMLK